ncbi:MAG: DedA family protein [Pararhodobacter sp.]
MMETAALLPLIREHGLLIIGLLALVEGPIVSVIGGSLAGAGVLSLWALLAVVIAGDLLGDIVLYAVGRRGGRLLPEGLRERLLQQNPDLQARLRREVEDHGARLLVLGKLTHAAGFAVLLAAGAARYPFGRFLIVSLLVTALKCALLVALGWWLGEQWASAEAWMDRALLVLLLLALVAAGLWLHHGRRRPA